MRRELVMIVISYNHDMFDDPYHQTKVNKGFNELEKILGEYGKFYFSFGDKRKGFFLDYHDEYVLVQHSVELNHEQKAQIVNAIKLTLTLKKTVYKDDFPEGCIVFEKIDEENCFTF